MNLYSSSGYMYCFHKGIVLKIHEDGFLVRRSVSTFPSVLSRVKGTAGVDQETQLEQWLSISGICALN